MTDDDINRQILEQAKIVRSNKKFLKAIKIGDAQIVGDLIDDGVKYHKLVGTQLHQYSPDHDTALHTAVKLGHLDIVRLLIEDGVNINAQTRRLRTPCHYAVYPTVELEMLEYLVDKGGDITILDDDKATPLFWAAYFDKLDVAKYLIAQGNDPWTKDNFASPFEWACLRGSNDIVNYYLNEVKPEKEIVINAKNYATENCHAETVEIIQNYISAT